MWSKNEFFIDQNSTFLNNNFNYKSTFGQQKNRLLSKFYKLVKIE